MKLPYVLLQESALLAGLQEVGDKGWNLLDDIYQGHGWPPVFVFLRDDVNQQVPSVGDGGARELRR